MERLPKLSDYDKKRLLECLGCRYFRQCCQTVKEPEDNQDGSCKTKMLFEEDFQP